MSLVIVDKYAVFLQIVPSDQVHELLPAVPLLECSLDVLLHQQTGIMVPVDCLRPAIMLVMGPA